MTTPRPSTAPVDHVVIGAAGFLCKHCGMRRHVVLPISINDLIKSGKEFTKRHKHCIAK